MGHVKDCMQKKDWHTVSTHKLIIKLKQEENTFVQETPHGCSPMMIRNARTYQLQSEKLVRKEDD